MTVKLKKFTVTAVKTVDLVTEFTVEAENETEAERVAESRVSDDEHNVPGCALQWDEEDYYTLDIPEVIAIEGNVI